MSFLTLRGVSKAYGSVVAVDRVDLDIGAGTRTAIIGPSGCGKTTLLRLVGGFERPDAGEIALADRTLAGGGSTVPPHLRPIGYVTQDGALFPHLSVAGNIAFGLDRGAPGQADRVAELMRSVGMPPHLGERRPHELSGGQQQRVALARALARRPAVMLLDEPFSALDAGLREAMREMMGDVLGAAGITTILVTHDQTEALSFADQLVVMRDGRLVQTGSPADLYERPRDPETAVFLGDAIILDAELAESGADCVLGRVAVASGGRTGTGKIMLRPEQVSVREANGAGGASDGRVVSRSFRGPTRKLVVEFANGADTAAKPPCRLSFVASSSAAPPVGSRVTVEVTGPAHVFAEAD